MSAMNIEWSQVIKDLESRGWTMHGIAKRIGVAYSTVTDIKTGRTVEPRGWPAVKLAQLHKSGRGPAEKAA